MTEREFWQFLEGLWKEKGRVNQVSGVIDGVDSELKSHGRYIAGHALLPNDYDKIPGDQIIKMSELLFDRSVSQRTKEAVMIISAHISSKTALDILKKYSKMPDKGLEIFAELALDECEAGNIG